MRGWRAGIEIVVWVACVSVEFHGADICEQLAKDASLDFNLISLFPPTYKNRPNGLRIDLAEAFAALKPVSIPTFFTRTDKMEGLVGN